jgi:hypothetical protein
MRNKCDKNKINLRVCMCFDQIFVSLMSSSNDASEELYICGLVLMDELSFE